LATVILGEGLEEIGEREFFQCTLLHEISMPPAVKVIKDGAFYRCSQLTTAFLGEGLEEVRVAASAECTSLQEIAILLRAGHSTVARS
jgi:hypothetical protein